MNTTAPALPSTSTPSSVSSLSSCVDSSNGNPADSSFANILAQTTTPEAAARPGVTAKAATKSRPKTTDKPASGDTADSEATTSATTEAPATAAGGVPADASKTAALVNPQFIAQMTPQVVQPQVANIVAQAPTQTAVSPVTGKAAETAVPTAVGNPVTPETAQLVDASTTAVTVAGGLKAQTIAKSADTPIAVSPATPESIPTQANNSQLKSAAQVIVSPASQQPAANSNTETKVVAEIPSTPTPGVTVQGVQTPALQATSTPGAASQTVPNLAPQNQPASPSPTNVVNTEQVAGTQTKDAAANTPVQTDVEAPVASDGEPVSAALPVLTTLPNDIRPVMTRVTTQAQPVNKQAESKAASATSADKKTDKSALSTGLETVENGSEADVQPDITSHIETGVVTDSLAPVKTPAPKPETTLPDALEPIPASNTLAPASTAALPASVGTVSGSNAGLAQAQISTNPKPAAQGSSLSEAVTSKSATISAAVIEAANPTDNIQPHDRNVAMERSTMVSLGSSVAAESSTSQTAQGEEQGAGSNQRRSSAGPEAPDTRSYSNVSGSATSSESFKAAKVEAASQPASHTADRLRVIDQVTQKLDTMRLVNGRQEININLRPDHLGEVKLTIVADKQNVTAHIVAETSSARDAMQNGRDHLREALEQKGYTLQGLDVSLSNGGGERRFAPFQQNSQSSPAHQASVRGTGLTESSVTTGSGARSVERALSAAGRLDYEA